MKTEPKSRLCPRCHTSGMVSTLEVDESTIPKEVWKRMDRRRKQPMKTKKAINPGEWWFCINCGYHEDLEEFLQRYTRR